MIKQTSKKEPHIAVIGDLMIDEYIFGSCTRISPEAPVQVVNVQKSEYRLGGAGNVVSNLLALEAKVSLFSVTGEDDNSRILNDLLKQKGLEHISLLCDSSRQSTKKSRIIASNQQIVRFDSETTEPIGEAFEDLLINRLKEYISCFDAIILSDYDKGVLTSSLCQRVIALAGEHSIMVLVDPKGKNFAKYRNATLLTPNKKEAAAALDMDIDTALPQALERLKTELHITYPLITLSEDGIALLDEDKAVNIPTVAKEVYDVTGAGDTVISALAIALCNHLSIKNACKFANAAAAVVVAKVGSATATLKEIRTLEESIGKNHIESKIVTLNQLLLKLKSLNKKVVFTNGCFDILHPGHASYLAKAKELGDILVVGLNSDASVKRLKGDSRPINTEEDRAFMLAALGSTDYIVTFEQDTPYELIKAIKPDILVKGADYKDKEVIGSDIAKEVRLITFVEGKSTTRIIRKIACNED
jgi:D-beta-D-heptose 7-phosphate kinase/D-beta-D-heptose 1-phosphate adenosyltransferase